jgi:hypothetical protein
MMSAVYGRQLVSKTGGRESVAVRFRHSSLMAISERVDAHQTANLALPQGNRFDSENSR